MNSFWHGDFHTWATLMACPLIIVDADSYHFGLLQVAPPLQSPFGRFS